MNGKKLFALVMAATVAVFSICGCSAERLAIAATYDGGEIPAGVYIYNQMTAATAAYNMLGNPYLTPQNLLTQKIEGIPAEQWINQQAAELTRIHAAIQSEAERLGVTLDEELVNGISGQLEASWETDGASMEKLGITLQSVKDVNLNSLLYSELFNSRYGEGGSSPVSDDELKEYFLENYRRGLLCAVPLYDLNTAAQLGSKEAGDARAAYESYKADIAAGGSLMDVIVREQQRINDLMGVAEPMPEVTEAELETLFYKPNSGYPEELHNMIFAADAPLNTPLYYEHESFLVIFELRDTMGDGSVFEQNKEALASVYKSQEFSESLIAAADSINFTMIDNAARAFPVIAILNSQS